MYDFVSLNTILPEIILLIGGCVVLLLGQSARESVSRLAPGIVLATIIIAIAIVVGRSWSQDALALPEGGSGLLYGPLAVFARRSALVLGVIITFIAWLQPQRSERGEFWSMVLFSLLGVLLVGAANDLLVLFIALELVSIPTYVMVVLSRRSLRALEAGTKYFYLGAMAAAIMAFGFSLLYGVAGSASLPTVVREVSRALSVPGTTEYGIAAIGVALSLGGLLFKIGAVPLHFYIADVYHGAAPSVAGLLGFVPKFAGFVAICKIMVVTGHWEIENGAVFWLLWIIAAVSMTVGNTLALIAVEHQAHAGVLRRGSLRLHAGGRADRPRCRHRRDG